jgi:phosphoglycolate phosphatase-like HAD superfamily hydrolase
VKSVTDKSSDSYVAPADRIAIFDFDGTLYGERYPTYFDTCLFIHRALHDETFTAPEDIREYAKAMEEALYNHLPEPDSDKSTAQCAAECFKGMTTEEYREYVKTFMASPAFGFEGMTYAEGFYKPMTEVVKYLAENDFTIFISSGSERAMVRELIKGSLDEWIPSDRVIGSTFSLIASGQGTKAGRKYTISADDQILMEGNLVTKNQNTNKVFSIIDEIGKCPILVFGNSSGDLAMAQYVLQHGGKGYMLLCDDTERDYGDLAVAAKFADSCEKMGLETVSMKNDFATIYGDNAVKVDQKLESEEQPEQQEEQELAPAA